MNLEKEALNGTLKVFSLQPRTKDKHDLEVSLVKLIPKVETVLLTELHLAYPLALKYQLSVHVQLKKYEYTGGEDYAIRYNDPHFNSDSSRFDSGYQELSSSALQIISRFDSFIQQGSGWILDHVILSRLKVYRVQQFQGGEHVESNGLPECIKKKRACLNVKNTRGKCFVYSCLAHLHPVDKNADRRSHYDRHIHELNLNGLSFPLKLKHVKVFERNNPNLSVNILSWEGKKAGIIPIYRTINATIRDSRKRITLLLHKDHYYLVKNMSRLLNDRHSRSCYFCHFCLCRYPTLQRLEEHETLCTNKLQKLCVPRPSTIEFEHYRHLFMLPFVIYYDIESLLVQNETTGNVDHVPISVCSFTMCSSEQFKTPPIVFTGSSCVSQFLDHLGKEEKRIVNILYSEKSELQCDTEDEERVEQTSCCEICKKPFDTAKKYRDHDHLSWSARSNMRYVTCNRCNLTYGRQTRKIPVVAHNASRYDTHHIVLALRDTSRVEILAKTTEQYICMRLGKRLVFVDSMNFLAGSLDNMARLLPNEDVDPFLDFITADANARKLLRQKSIFPYDYLDSTDKLAETELPSKEHFYNSLSQSHIEDSDYQRARLIWREFNCRTLKDYLELYVCLDTLLLAAMVESYRASTHKHFGLDPLHYVSAPSLCFDAMLKITNVQLDTLPSVDMYLFFTKSIRGGMAGASSRHAVANNDCCRHYDPAEPVSHMIALDANNLYGHSLSQQLPTGEFRWLTSAELETFDVSTVPENSAYGYVLEVDLHYPEHLHDVHNDYPLAPEKLDVPAKDWSDHTRLLAQLLNMKQKSSGTKLMATLRDKSRYILHYKNLQFYLQHGLQLTKLHRGIRFRQSSFLKPYILMNNAARTRATTPFQISLYKGYNNYIFGKTCYNVFKQVHLKLVNSEKKFQQLAARATFHGSHVISEHMIGVEMKPAKILCDKPVYIGSTVLDLSKKHMYSFYYDFLVPLYYDEGLRMVYTDTDSFYLQVFNKPDFYHDLLRYERFFDRSAYPEHHFLHSDSRKRELGLMKDVHANGVITEIVALRSKMYAVSVESSNQQKKTVELKAKGVKKSLLSKELRFESYSKCLRDSATTIHHYHQIRSYKHHLVTKQSTKVGLSSYDDKRYLLPCGIHSYAYGHYRTKTVQQCSDCAAATE